MVIEVLSTVFVKRNAQLIFYFFLVTIQLVLAKY